MSEGLFYPEKTKEILHTLGLKMEDIGYRKLKKLDGWIDDFREKEMKQQEFERESRIDDRLAKLYLSEENNEKIVKCKRCGKRLDKLCELCETCKDHYRYNEFEKVEQKQKIEA